MMKIKELYQAMPSDYKDILKQINSYVLGNLWSTQPSTVSTAQRTAISNNIWASIINKDVSITILNFCELNNIDINNLTSQQAQNIYVMLFMKYADKWAKLWTNVYLQDYNPIWNVDGTESITHTFEHGKTVTETKNLTHTMNKGSTDTTTVNSDITENSRNGFNSASAVPVGKSSHTGSSTVTGSGYDSDVDTGTDTYANTGTDTERETKTRGGNIGVTSTQNMLEQEIELRNEFMYFDIVSKDIINALTMNIYN